MNWKRKDSPHKNGTAGTFAIFLSILGRTSSNRRIQFAILFFAKVAVGLWESLTVAAIAGFASMLVNIESAMENRIFMIIGERAPGLLPGSPREMVIGGAIVITLLVVLRNGTRMVSLYMSNRFASKLQSEVGMKIIETVFARPYSWFISQQASDIIQIFQWRFNYGGFLQQYLELMTKTIVITALLVTIFISSLSITLPILGVLSLISLIIFKATRPGLDKTSKRLKQLNWSSFKEVSSSVHGYKDVRLHKAEDALHERMRHRFAGIVRMKVRESIYQSAPAMIVEIFSYAMMTIVIAILFARSDGEVEGIIGLMAMLAIVSWRVTPLVSQILHSQATLRSSIPYLKHILDFLGDEKTVFTPTSRIHSDQKHDSFSSLVVRDLGFSYTENDERILGKVSFTVRRGDKIGIIGSSGGGKSTLVDLIAGLLQPEEGSIEVNGRELPSDEAARWQGAIGYLPQHPYVFPGSISDNIALGVSTDRVDSDRVSALLHTLGLGDFTDRNGEGDKVLFEQGKNISGGQAQRLALARLLYEGHDFLIIDEGTSALDASMERRALAEIFTSGDELSMLIITHRFESLSVCDKILWLDGGTIRMFGDSDEVINAYRAEI